eukprot:CAMPEP_0202109566 /NCGR_PEP_ID=MMETSP0965-20130614/24147_1 /ASSEMBLY_ACC=CAM_ASM_000507 /TAXON_ID=4773 /ORGANISM="Schizochytrium aggregatum, Strain ATCC28209" /LENGTH=102 /DNA_ID=CAMNT_0048678911 /DNA_START=55 /DNA_END=360 /DNA_ORIENTATION=+
MDVRLVLGALCRDQVGLCIQAVFELDGGQLSLSIFDDTLRKASHSSDRDSVALARWASSDLIEHDDLGSAPRALHDRLHVQIASERGVAVTESKLCQVGKFM